MRMTDQEKMAKASDDAEREVVGKVLRGAENCSNCKKDLIQNGKSMVAFQFMVNSESEFDEKFIREQVGDYKLDRPYALCWECTLKGFGFKV